MDAPAPKPKVGHRFGGFLPVVVDVETGGFIAQTDALLEIAAVILGLCDKGILIPKGTVFGQVTPFPGPTTWQMARVGGQLLALWARAAMGRAL